MGVLSCYAIDVYFQNYGVHIFTIGRIKIVNKFKIIAASGVIDGFTLVIISRGSLEL